jgi:hypothetical protein
MNASVWFHKMCRQLQVTSIYISVNVNGTNVQCLDTLRAVTGGALNVLKKYNFVYTYIVLLLINYYKFFTTNSRNE